MREPAGLCASVSVPLWSGSVRRRSKSTVWVLLATLLLTAPLLAGCGRKGNLDPPPGAESQYPRQYPTPEPYPVPEPPPSPEEP